jgi:hypothetical protein
MSVVSLVKDLSMKKFNGITAVCFVDSVYSMLLYLLVYGKKQFESTYFFVSEAISVEVQSKLKYKQFLSLHKMEAMPLIKPIRYLSIRFCRLIWMTNGRDCNGRLKPYSLFIR